MYKRTVQLELGLKIYDATNRTYVNAECKRNPKWKIYITDSIHNFPGNIYLYFISKAEENKENNTNSKSFIVYFSHRYVH